LAWNRVRGHDRLVEAFRRVVVRGRLAHAYLFVGPAGVGKRTFAEELAKALLCEGSVAPSSADMSLQLQACEECPACIQVGAGTHPDFFAAARPGESQEFPVDLMRQVCHSFALRPARGRGKVVVVDDADDLNEEAANCFLKTLEEPPPRSVLILIGSSPERQLATVVSRCQVIRFRPLSRALIEEVLQAQGLSDAVTRQAVASTAGGSPGRALVLANPKLWEFRRHFVQGLAGSVTPTDVLGRSIVEFVEGAGKEATAQRRLARLVVGLLIDFLNDALALNLGGSPRRTPADDVPALEALATQIEPDNLLVLMERCLEAVRQLDRNVHIALVLEALLDALGQELRS
jgi:DNA polymerase-3 subunit delta'